MAKSWKSGFLLNCVSYAKRYNTFPEKDGLKPVICYLTMENTNEETLTRLWAHCFGNNSSIASYSKVEAARMLEQAGLFTPNDPYSPEVVIWYRSNKSINTADLMGMLQDLEKEGKYCVFLVLDYISRIRPVETSKELRIELSNITNELKTIAMELDIPILTAAQLNRSAFECFEQAETFEEKLRSLEKLGAANIGDSIDVVRNCDCSFIVNKVQKRVVNEDGDIQYQDNYLFVKLISCRTKQPQVISFKHRFKDNNDMALIEDINMVNAQSTNTEIEFIRDRLKANEQKSRRTVIGNK